MWGQNDLPGSGAVAVVGLLVVLAMVTMRVDGWGQVPDTAS
jgi:hypothetical protein